MPCPGPFHFSYSVDYIYDFCPLSDPDVGLSVFVCDVEHTSFHFGLCGRKFVLSMFGQCPGICTICHSWQHTRVVHLSPQTDGKVAFEDVPVFGVCRPACHDSSLYLFDLVLFLEAVVLSQIHVALDIFYQHIVHVYWGVVDEQAANRVEAAAGCLAGVPRQEIHVCRYPWCCICTGNS